MGKCKCGSGHQDADNPEFANAFGVVLVNCGISCLPGKVH